MNAPLLDTLARYHDAPWLGFHTPGHFHGQAASSEALATLGRAAYACDLTELDETDNLHAPAGVIREAQRLAAEAHGADESYFLVNGSTCGIQALILATCPPGSRLLLSRATHLSTFGALVLSGAEPLYINSGWNTAWQLPAPPTAAAIQALAARQRCSAVLLTRPDYFGFAPPMAPLTRACQQADLPLLVDEAHGAHLGLEPRLPAPALAGGADAVVQSTHKLASALTQASMLHLLGNRLDPVRVRRALRLLQTSSPSYLLLASLDAARAQRPTTPWAAILDEGEETRRRLARLGLPTLGASHGPPGDWDPAKLIVDLSGTGHSGLDLAARLHDSHQIQVELATPRYLGLILTPAHTRAHLERFEGALLESLRARRPAPLSLPDIPGPPPQASRARDAFLGPARGVPLAKAHGEVAAEFVCPYPPGLPALIPGERIEPDTLAYLLSLQRMGASFVGPEDPSLETIQVCEHIPS